MKPLATILQSGICLTNAFPRPRPSLFFFPGLHSQPVYSSEDFAISSTLKRETENIRDEYLQWRAQPSAKSDYEMHVNEHKLHDGKWDWNSYILKGKKQAEFAVHCPKTTTVLEGIPSLMHSVPFSYAFFSTLFPKTTIDPHYGPCNIRLRCHLPLLVPEGDCGMKIAGLDVKWQVGVPLFFDDSYEHSVWNNTNQERVVLLFDVWHPDLIPEEIEAIVTMFQEAEKQRKGSSGPGSSGSRGIRENRDR